MKSTVLTIVILMLTLAGFAQVTITLTPETVNASVIPDSFETRAKATLRNTSTQTKRFLWTRTIKSMTTGWKSLVCDKNLCWASTVNTPLDTIVLAANATSNLDVYIQPDRKIGAAMIEVKVFEVGNAANTITGKYNFTSTTRTKDVNNGANQIKIYPNPAIDYFQIAENDLVDKVVIYNIIGRQVRVYKAEDGTRYSVSDLPDGFYIIRLLNGTGQTVKTIRLSKSRPRA
jgi:predicted Zn-dependent protease with MMP-like domain